MTHIRQTVIAMMAAAALILSPTHAAAGTMETAAVAVNRQDGGHVAKHAFQIRRTTDDEVEAKNTAYAYSRCAHCKTVAGSVQVALLMSNPRRVEPTNLAIAVNDQCTSCRTLATAYQFVMITDGPVHFTEQGSDRIEQIRQEFAQTIQSGELTVFEIRDRVDVLMSELDHTLRSELVRSGRAGTVHKDRKVDQGEE